jgi:hypothetical protein
VPLMDVCEICDDQHQQRGNQKLEASNIPCSTVQVAPLQNKETELIHGFLVHIP